MAKTLSGEGIEVVRFWEGEDARFEVYRQRDTLSNMRRADVKKLIELLQAALEDEEKKEP